MLSNENRISRTSCTVYMSLLPPNSNDQGQISKSAWLVCNYLHRSTTPVLHAKDCHKGRPAHETGEFYVHARNTGLGQDVVSPGAYAGFYPQCNVASLKQVRDERVGHHVARHVASTESDRGCVMVEEREIEILLEEIHGNMTMGSTR